MTTNSRQMAVLIDGDSIDMEFLRGVMVEAALSRSCPPWKSVTVLPVPPRLQSPDALVDVVLVSFSSL